MSLIGTSQVENFPKILNDLSTNFKISKMFHYWMEKLKIFKNFLRFCTEVVPNQKTFDLTLFSLEFYQ